MNPSDGDFVSSDFDDIFSTGPQAAPKSPTPAQSSVLPTDATTWLLESQRSVLGGGAAPSTSEKAHAEFHPATFAAAKARWLQNQLQEREAEYVERQDITVFVGTWNVNGKPPQESLDGWLLPSAAGEKQAELYAVGFQELDLSANALLLNDTSKSVLWEDAISRSLNSRGVRYTMIGSRQLVGMLLCVFVREDLRQHVGHIAAVAEGVGLMGMMGNKGGVGIRIRFFDSTLVFVNSHLSAHQENIERRNQDYRDISRRLAFPAIPVNYNGLDQRLLLPKLVSEFADNRSPLPTPSNNNNNNNSNNNSNNSNGDFSSIFDHEHMFWLGDLNYRIDLPDWQCKQLITARNWAALLARDQLVDQMAKKCTFDGWQEGVPDFAPTYKYDVGTGNYDSSEKRRIPAWCDRVLWRTRAHAAHIRLLALRRHELLSSDHRPVSCLLQVSLKQINLAVRAKMFSEMVKHLDMLENELTPDVQLSTNLVQLGAVHYMVAKSEGVTMENTGQVIARFRFIPKLNEHQHCKPWLWVNPSFGMLVPGERLKINFTAYVDNTTAESLNTGQDELEDTLIIHIENSKDCFISVQGSYQQSVFGCPISYLVRFVGPLRSAKPLPEEATDEHLSVPKELWQLVDLIYQRGLSHENLFLETGVQQEMEQIREALATGQPLEELNCSAYSLGEALVRLLESFPQPVVPFALYRQCLESAHSFTVAKQLLSFLPPVHYNVFHYITSFLREVLSHADQNQLTANQLAMLFGSVMLRPSPSEATVEDPSISRRRAQFINNFLEPESSH